MHTLAGKSLLSYLYLDKSKELNRHELSNLAHNRKPMTRHKHTELKRDLVHLSKG